jgi:hypothetical protein
LGYAGKPKSTDDELELLSTHAAARFDKNRSKFLVRKRVAKNRLKKEKPNPAEQEPPNPVKQEPPNPVKQEPPNPVKRETPKPAEQEPPNPVKQQPAPIAICDWNYESRQAEMKVDGKLVYSTEIFQEKPAMGQASPVSAKFADVVARVAAIYWGVVAAPKGATAVFRDFAKKPVSNNN